MERLNTSTNLSQVMKRDSRMTKQKSSAQEVKQRHFSNSLGSLPKSQERGKSFPLSGLMRIFTRLMNYWGLDLFSKATESLEHALALSPRNSKFLSERVNIYQREKNWSMALQTFQLAETAAKEFAPPDTKNMELSLAWRGIAYVLVEQNRLDEAEKMYQQCLELDKNDPRAMNELRYIRSLKAKNKEVDLK